MNLTRRNFLSVSATAVATGAGLAPLVGADPAKPQRLVMIAGSPSHPAGFHEFNAGVRLLDKCLKNVKGLETVVLLNGYPKDDSVLDSADGILCYSDGGGGHPLIREQRLKRIGGLMAKGVGLMCMHYAVEVPKDLGGPEFKNWIGGYYETGWSCNPMWTPEKTTLAEHAITRGVKPFSVRDEWYFNMRFRDDRTEITPIFTAIPPDTVRDGPYVAPKGPYKHIQEAKGRPESLMWCVERPDGGRGVGFTGGHTHHNWIEPNYRKIVLNALVWICKAIVPVGGIVSEVTEEDLRQNLDPKPPRKKA